MEKVGSLTVCLYGPDDQEICTVGRVQVDGHGQGGIIYSGEILVHLYFPLGYSINTDKFLFF